MHCVIFPNLEGRINLLTAIIKAMGLYIPMEWKSMERSMHTQVDAKLS